MASSFRIDPATYALPNTLVPAGTYNPREHYIVTEELEQTSKIRRSGVTLVKMPEKIKEEGTNELLYVLTWGLHEATFDNWKEVKKLIVTKTTLQEMLPTLNGQVPIAPGSQRLVQASPQVQQQIIAQVKTAIVGAEDGLLLGSPDKAAIKTSIRASERLAANIGSNPLFASPPAGKRKTQRSSAAEQLPNIGAEASAVNAARAASAAAKAASAAADAAQAGNVATGVRSSKQRAAEAAASAASSAAQKATEAAESLNASSSGSPAVKSTKVKAAEAAASQAATAANRAASAAAAVASETPTPAVVASSKKAATAAAQATAAAAATAAATAASGKPPLAPKRTSTRVATPAPPKPEVCEGCGRTLPKGTTHNHSGGSRRRRATRRNRY